MYLRLHLYPCVSLVLVSRTSFKSLSLWEKFGLDCVLDKGNQSYKFIGKFRYLGIKKYHKTDHVYKRGISRKYQSCISRLNQSWDILPIYCRNCK